MIVLSCTNINKSFATEEILRDISFNVHDGDKIGIVGLNGCGKTTLFNILDKRLHYDSGEIYLRKGMKLGYLEQHTQIKSQKTIYQECLTVFEDLMKMEAELRALEKEIALEGERGESEKLNRLMSDYSDLSEKFAEENGYGYESSIRGILIGLGFKEDDFQRPVDVLSGGQKSRLSLAKLLLEKPNVLLLDEPTNHLDIDAIDWLAKFIIDYKGAVLLISHDRYFLDMVVNRIFHMEHLKMTEYNTNYTDFIKRRKENIEIHKRHFEDQQKEIERQKKIIEQYRTYGGERYNRLAKSREKMLEKIEIMDKHVETKKVRFRFKPKLESGNDVLEARSLGKSFGEKELFKNLDFSIFKGERVGLIGPNGVGKSTLFKIILGKISDYEGQIKLGHNVMPGYFDQEMKTLNLENTIIDEIWDDNPNLTHTQIRNILSQFMFVGDDVFKEIGDLSGGEKGRLSLLKLIMSKANFLLMDEPTNHLDIDSKEVLEDALLDYEGTVFVISHDRYFLNRVVDKILVMNKDGIVEYLGNYDYYLEKINALKLEEEAGPEKTKTEIQKEKKKDREKVLEERRVKRELKKMEESIFNLELEIEEIDEKLSDNEIYSDPEKVFSLTEDREKVSLELEKLYESWISITED